LALRALFLLKAIRSTSVGRRCGRNMWSGPGFCSKAAYWQLRLPGPLLVSWVRTNERRRADCESFFADALSRLETARRYHVFADIKRSAGLFLHAMWLSPTIRGAPKFGSRNARSESSGAIVSIISRCCRGMPVSNARSLPCLKARIPWTAIGPPLAPDILLRRKRPDGFVRPDYANRSAARKNGP